MAKKKETVGGGALDRFGRLTRGKKIAVFVVLGLVLGGLYWYLFYGDMSDELVSAKSEATKLGTEATELKQRQEDFKKLQAEKKELENAIKKNNIQLPKSAPLPSFVMTLQGQMQVANVQLRDVKPLPEAPFDGNIRVPVQIEVTGDFYQLVEFFKLLYETQRIITVADLSIGEGKQVGDQRVLTAKFTASTFRATEAPPPPPAGAAPGKPGAPAQPGKPGAPAPGAPPANGGNK